MSNSTALFNPASADEVFGPRLPFDMNSASLYRSCAQEMLAKRPGADRQPLQRQFVQMVLRPMTATLQGAPRADGGPPALPIDFRPSTRMLIRILALLAVEVGERSDPMACELHPRMLEAMARLPAGAGNTVEDAAEAERSWLRDSARVFLPMLKLGAEATFSPPEDGDPDTLAALFRAALKGLNDWRNDANAELIRSWGLPVTAVFESTLPGSMVLGGAEYTLGTGEPTFVVGSAEESVAREERSLGVGARKVYLKFPPTLADDSEVPRYALLGSIGPQGGFTPEPKNAALAKCARITASLSDLVGAVIDAPVQNLRAPGEDKAEASFLTRMAPWMNEPADDPRDPAWMNALPQGDAPRRTDKQVDADTARLIEGMMGEPDLDPRAPTQRPPAPRPQIRTAAPDAPTAFLPPPERKHRAMVREIRTALAMGPKEFLNALMVVAPTFSNPTEYAQAVIEWEALPGELNNLELLVLASGLGLPMEFLVSYLDGELLLSGLLKRRQPVMRAAPSPRGPSEW